MFRSFELALDKGLTNDDLRGDMRQLTSLLCFNLPSHRLKVSLHSVDAHRNAIDERERLRVFCQHGRKDAWDNASELTWFLAGLLRKIPVLASEYKPLPCQVISPVEPDGFPSRNAR